MGYDPSEPRDKNGMWTTGGGGGGGHATKGGPSGLKKRVPRASPRVNYNLSPSEVTASINQKRAAYAQATRIMRGGGKAAVPGRGKK